jgi:hypothetical protein
MNEYMAKNKIDVVLPPPDKVQEKKKVATVEIGGGTEDTPTNEKPEGEKPADDNKTAPAQKPAA